MRYAKWLGVLLISACAYVQMGVAQAVPQNGWWWNPAESGRGFFLEVRGSTLFIAGYFYDADGRATWLVSGGPISGPDTYAGRLFAVRDGQTLLGDYKAPTGVDAGAITLAFADPAHGTVTWPGGSIAIQRQVWSGQTAAFNLNGWWWNPDESGRGYSIEVQGDVMVMAAFMYDGQGNPVWYLSSGTMTTPGHYDGSLLQFSGGQTLSGPYRAPTYAPIGHVTIHWTSSDEATLTFSDDLPRAAGALPAKKSKVIPVRPQLPKQPTPPPAQWPSAWYGPFSQHYYFDASSSGASVIGVLHLHAHATWLEDVVAPLAGGSAYKLAGSVELDWNWKVLDDHTTCTGSHYEAVSLSGGDGYLNVGADGAYTGQIQRKLPFTYTNTCVWCDEC